MQDTFYMEGISVSTISPDGGSGNTGLPPRIPSQPDHWDAPDAIPDRLTPSQVHQEILDGFIGDRPLRVHESDIDSSGVLAGGVYVRVCWRYKASHLARLLGLHAADVDYTDKAITYWWAGNHRGVPIRVISASLLGFPQLDSAA